jgi:hypothetical protein
MDGALLCSAVKPSRCDRLAAARNDGRDARPDRFGSRSIDQWQMADHDAGDFGDRGERVRRAVKPEPQTPGAEARPITFLADGHPMGLL